MIVVNGMVKDVATLFVGFSSVDMRRLLNREPITIPACIEVPEDQTQFQIVFFGGETDESLREQVPQLGAAIFNVDERRPN